MKTLEPLAETPLLAATVRDYLGFVEELPYAALLVAADEDLCDHALQYSIENGYRYASTWKGAIWHLRRGHSTALELRDPLPRETYLLLAQYHARAGAIQIFEAATFTYHFATCEPQNTHLLLVTTEQDLSLIEQRYPIVDKVGLIERVRNGSRVRSDFE